MASKSLLAALLDEQKRTNDLLRVLIEASKPAKRAVKSSLKK